MRKEEAEYLCERFLQSVRSRFENKKHIVQVVATYVREIYEDEDSFPWEEIDLDDFFTEILYSALSELTNDHEEVNEDEIFLLYKQFYKSIVKKE